MDKSVNKRLKLFLDSLPDSYTTIAENTGIPRRTLYDLIKEGASIKHNYLISLCEKYDMDIDYIFFGPNEVSETPRMNESPPNLSYLNKINHLNLNDRQKDLYDKLVHFLVHLKNSGLPPELKISIIDTVIDEIDQLLNHADNR